jgi:F-type H+-transporting ATPase subunit b
VDALGINLGFFIAQLVNFGIIFGLLYAFAWPRVVQMLDERSERIAMGLEDARAAQEARANAEEERDKLLREARAEGQRGIEEARQRGEEQMVALVREAQREADNIRVSAREQAEEERNRILGESREQIISLAMAAAERLIGKSLDDKQQKAVVKAFFSDVPAEAKNLGTHITVVSALPLEDDEKAQVAKVTGAEEIDYRVDPAILGGLILRAGDRVVDGSVRGDLTTLKARLN